MRTKAPQLLTGGEAVAHAMRQIDPDVVPVYPITPQTPIIQKFASFVADGKAETEIINVESEHSAMSAAIGNRALSGPINIHADHSDSMLVRDSGVIQLFAENAQEAYDLMLLATRLAEHPDVLLPVFVCQDGFTITHSAEPVELLDDEAVREFVGEYRIPFPLLDIARPTSQGTFAMPDYYFELRHHLDVAMDAARDALPALSNELSLRTGRTYPALEEYELAGAERVVIAMGSTAGTAKDVVDELRA